MCRILLTTDGMRLIGPMSRGCAGETPISATIVAGDSLSVMPQRGLRRGIKLPFVAPVTSDELLLTHTFTNGPRAGAVVERRWTASAQYRSSGGI